MMIHSFSAEVNPKIELRCSSQSVHEVSYVPFHHMQLLKQLHPLAMQLLKLLLIYFVDMLVLPRHTAMHILFSQHRLVVIQTEPPTVGNSINVFDACMRKYKSLTSVTMQHMPNNKTSCLLSKKSA